MHEQSIASANAAEVEREEGVDLHIDAGQLQADDDQAMQSRSFAALEFPRRSRQIETQDDFRS